MRVAAYIAAALHFSGSTIDSCKLCLDMVKKALTSEVEDLFPVGEWRNQFKGFWKFATTVVLQHLSYTLVHGFDSWV